jgi:hypothetical protein
MVSGLSLMPGTLSAELEEDATSLVVHALTGSAMASVATLQARIRWLFGLPQDPQPSQSAGAPRP